MGIEIFVQTPDVVSYSKVTAAARKSGDFSVLSQTDIMLLALAAGMHEEHATKTAELKKVEAEKEPVSNGVETPPAENVPGDDAHEEVAEHNAEVQNAEAHDNEAQEGPGSDDILETREPLDAQTDNSAPPDISNLSIEDSASFDPSHSASSAPTDPPASTTTDDISATASPSAPTPLFEDPSSSEDDGEGEWITPDNVAAHKAKQIYSVDGTSSKQKQKPIGVGCMTADYAMQNVLLHMGLNLVSPEGKRITMVKTWVLRCHGCYKLCKDQSKKFCPSCGGDTLLRASVSTKAAPPGSSQPATVQVHLKSNFQYRTRGTKYSIPTPKPGNAKGTNGGAGNIILREDQVEFQRGVKSEAVRARKEEKKIASALASKSVGGTGEKNWMDPDWMPDMLLGQSARRGSALPDVGYGRRNPNEVRKKKR
ncbi:hypothetical protein DL93DRAFT_2087857 [Clavulina sp. PMI_390]|nr:hypothetical protein DL93DRAFT_2087857 [Clavulina sp. PMI_390]